MKTKQRATLSLPVPLRIKLNWAKHGPPPWRHHPKQNSSDRIHVATEWPPTTSGYKYARKYTAKYTAKASILIANNNSQNWKTAILLNPITHYLYEAKLSYTGIQIYSQPDSKHTVYTFKLILTVDRFALFTDRIHPLLGTYVSEDADFGEQNLHIPSCCWFHISSGSVSNADKAVETYWEVMVPLCLQ